MDASAPILDRWQRPLGNLRVSVTDRCNLRCGYCMPEQDYKWLPRADILTFEEIDALVGVFCSLGVERVRLTGGEPLIRKDLPKLVALLARRSELRDLAMTTNGLMLAEQVTPERLLTKYELADRLRVSHFSVAKLTAAEHQDLFPRAIQNHSFDQTPFL